MSTVLVSSDRFLELYQVDVKPYITTYSGFDYIRNGFVPVLINTYLPGYEIIFEISEQTNSPLHLLPDGSGYLVCYLAHGEAKSLPFLYPIMSNPPKFAAIINPNSRDVNDNMARAGVKCLAFNTGLGLKLFTREDDVKPEVVEKRPATEKISAKKPLF